MQQLYLRPILQRRGGLTVVLILVGLACPSAASAQDTVRVVQLESKFLGTTETIKVWTPPGYDTDTARRFPVIYCCQNTGMPVRQLAQLMTAGDFPPFLLVNYEGPSKGGEYGAAAAWSDQRQPSGSFFRKEVLPWVDANYRTVATHKGRVLLGCSKAGGGVMHLGLKYPDLFGAVVSLDGALTLYDKPGKGLDYAKDGDTYLQLLEKHGDAVNSMPILLIEGGMFWKTGRDYLPVLRKAGLKDIEVIDDRDLGHNVSAMFERHLPEILTVFVNCTSGAGVSSPRIEPPGGVFAGSVKVTLTAPVAEMKLYYTKDGSDPAQRQQEYTGPVTLDKPCLLRVVGVWADGKQVTRQRLARFDIRLPLSPNAELGKNKGLALEVVEGNGGKRDLEFLRTALDGKAKRIYQGTASSFTIPEDAIRKILKGDHTVLFKGVLTVPESGVYHLQVTGSSAGLFLEEGKGALVKFIRTIGPASTVEAAVVLGKGSHRILGVSRWPRGSEPFQILLRNREGAFEPLPAGMLSH